MALRELEDGIRQLQLQLAAQQAQMQTLLQVSDPVGRMAPFAGSSAPAGWLICNGAAISRTQYPKLFAAIGISYGAGNGSTTFALPNARGRVLVGRDAGQTEFNTLGESGGAKTHTLTLAEMPAHSHSIQRPQWFGADVLTGGSTYSGFPNTRPGQATTTTTTRGADGAHNNLQPYLVTEYIIRAA
jgi:microcystin-dependent protein